jgi:hypothetical protein
MGKGQHTHSTGLQLTENFIAQPTYIPMHAKEFFIFSHKRHRNNNNIMTSEACSLQHVEISPINLATSRVVWCR